MCIRDRPYYHYHRNFFVGFETFFIKSINDKSSSETKVKNILYGTMIINPVSYTHLDVYKRQVHSVIDSDKADAFLWENHFRIHSHLQIVSP